MNDEKIVLSTEVKVRWAISEIVSDRTSVFYWESSLMDITAKIAAGSSFEILDVGEIERLLHAWELARGKFVGYYIQNAMQFTLQNWSRADFVGVYAMSEMDVEGKGRFVPFFEYAANAESDPRYVAASVVADRQPVHSTKYPITVALHRNMRVLIDGYGRSVLFLRAGRENDRIEAFVAKG